MRALLFGAMLLSAAEAGQGNLTAKILESKCAVLDEAERCALYGASVVELIANPLLFHGKRVRVIGYARLEFEGNAMYLSKESYETGVTKNAVWLFPPESVKKDEGTQWGPGYAVVEGRFDATDQGHMGAASGAITDITRFEEWAWTRR